MAFKIDNGQLSKLILNDRYNRFVFSTPQSYPVYLVGGYLRDLLKQKVSRDRDYVTGGDLESLLVRVVAGTGGKLVKIGNCLHRVVLKDNSTLDFTPMENRIVDDLGRRDFTINSLAWSPGTGLIDPHGGSQDLVKESIRMISKDNIENDPIRILRAYRFAGEFGMRIEKRTRRALKNLSFKLIDAKGERITLEFFKILNLDSVSKILRMMFHDQVLKHIISLTDGELRARLTAVSRVRRLFNAIPLKEKNRRSVAFSQNLFYEGLIPLEILLEGKPACALKMSSRILRRLNDVERGRLILSRGNWSADSLFEAFEAMQDAAVDFLLQKGRNELLSEYERYRTIKKKALLSTHEIVLATNVRGGHILGRMIRALRQAEFNRQISCKEDALLFLKAIDIIYHNISYRS
ncbi:MAG TPA: hypothetical protein VIO11_10675 [Candidatus Methanoperedens sp.]